MPSAWDDNANTNLLLSIIQILDPKPPNWDEVSAMIAAKGYDFTKEACRQHYQKLRKDAKQASGGASKATSGKATPRKRPAKSTAMTGDDDEELSETPAKKRKPRAIKPKKEKVKSEEKVEFEEKVESEESDGGMAVKTEENVDRDESAPFTISGDDEF